MLTTSIGSPVFHSQSIDNKCPPYDGGDGDYSDDHDGNGAGAGEMEREREIKPVGGVVHPLSSRRCVTMATL